MVVLALAAPAVAQTVPDAVVAPAAPAVPLVTLDLPSGPGAWVLHVSTGGGTMGGGAGQFVIASDGGMRCSRPCPASAAAGLIRSLRDAVTQAAGATWRSLPRNSMCFDCLVTFLTLTTRNEDGTMSIVRASWDPTTRAQLPQAVTRVSDLARQAVQPLTR